MEYFTDVSVVYIDIEFYMLLMSDFFEKIKIAE